VNNHPSTGPRDRCYFFETSIACSWTKQHRHTWFSACVTDVALMLCPEKNCTPRPLLSSIVSRQRLHLCFLSVVTASPHQDRFCERSLSQSSVSMDRRWQVAPVFSFCRPGSDLFCAHHVHQAATATRSEHTASESGSIAEALLSRVAFVSSHQTLVFPSLFTAKACGGHCSTCVLISSVVAPAILTHGRACGSKTLGRPRQHDSQCSHFSESQSTVSSPFVYSRFAMFSQCFQRQRNNDPRLHLNNSLQNPICRRSI